MSSDLDKQRRINLLEATLREIMRLKREADNDQSAVSFDDIFDAGRSDREWKSILRKAEHLCP
jgi:hypothetical protein